MKKIICILLAAVMVLSFTACGKNSGEKTLKVGICNYVDDASLNQIVDNIKSQLNAIGKEKGVKFDISYDNCNADANVMTQIIQNFIANGVDLMVGVATPVAMAMQSATEDNKIPVVFAAVSDPVSVELVDSLKKPAKNITGTSDYLNTDAIMELIFALKPETKTVGLLYDVGQDSSATPVKAAKKFLDKKGVKYIERTGTSVDEITLAAKALVSDKVDAVFTPTDNTVMQSELSIYEIFEKAGIPHFTGADSFALNGAFLGYGVDYANLGKETANTVAEILVDKKAAGDIPVKTFDNGIATVNTDVCKKLGFDFDNLKELFKPFCNDVQSIKTAENF